MIIIIMIRQYQHTFRSKTLIQSELYLKIIDQFNKYNINQEYNYDQLLYILDQIVHEKCDRQVLQELFKQSASWKQKITIRQIVQTYVENMETSKLCIMRDQFKVQQLMKSLTHQPIRSKTFVFLKIIQASIYTRFTKSPIFQYKIEPTQLPVFTLANALNPLINHEYTLQMQQQQFFIIFYESGIQILKWSFPDQHDLKEGEYSRFIKSQNVNFQLKIKYMPKNQNMAKQSIKTQIQTLKSKIQRQNDAFRKLCQFQPFLQKEKQIEFNQEESQNVLFKFTQNLFSFMPCLRQHVKVLHAVLIVSLIIQCWASSFWPIEFLDMCCCFYCLGILYDRSINDYHIKLIIMQLIFFLLILKSIWAGVYEPYLQKTKSNKVILVISSIVKGIIIALISITWIRRQQINKLREELINDPKPKDNEIDANIEHKKQYNIWQ